MKNFIAVLRKKMQDATVTSARDWADSLLSRVHRGPGDTIESAMHRAERKFGLPAQTFWTLRYRPPREIAASIYLRLQSAYEDECNKQLSRLRHEIDLTKRAMGHEINQDLLAEAEALVASTDEEAGK